MTRQLSTLTILHYVYGAFVCVGGVFALVLIFLGSLLSSDLIADNEGEPVPAWLGGLAKSLGWVLFVILEAWGILTILSGNWISKRKNRTGSQVVAAFNCLNIPFGVALGIFTFVVLNDTEVKSIYADPTRPIAD